MSTQPEDAPDARPVDLAGNNEVLPDADAGGSPRRPGRGGARCFPRVASEALRAQDHAAGPGVVAALPGLR